MLRSAVPLALLLVLQLSGSDGVFFHQTVREGDDVTLWCRNVLPDQNQCELTDWFIGNNPDDTVLFNNGKKDDAVSSSVSLLQNCSLVLHRVTNKQAGEYICQQSKREDEETLFYLFVASLSQEKEDDRVNLTCSVTMPGFCAHEVKWLHDNEEVTGDNEELQMSRSYFDCWASVSFKDPSPPSPFYKTLKCEIADMFTDQNVTLFPRAPDDKTTAATVGSSVATVGSSVATVGSSVATVGSSVATVGSSVATVGSSVTTVGSSVATVGSSVATPPTDTGHLIRNVLLIVGLVMLLLSVAALHLYARVKGRGASERSRTNVNTGGAVVYENVAEPSVSGRFHSQPSEN